jgi:hypothetical protein
MLSNRRATEVLLLCLALIFLVVSPSKRFEFVRSAIRRLFLARQEQFTDRAQVLHRQSSATVVANDARPLDQAITAIREEYGWAVSFEDPPYRSRFDLVESAQLLRESGVHHRIPAGGAFQSTYPEAPNLWSLASGEEEVLDKVVSDYNASRNPGKFVVRKQLDGTYTIIGDHIEDDNGNEVPVSSVLDTPITISTQTRYFAVTVNLILQTLSSRVGANIGYGGAGGGLGTAQVTVGGTNVSARSLLLQAIDGAEAANLMWDLLYDADGQAFYLNLTSAHRVNYDTFGRRTP